MVKLASSSTAEDAQSWRAAFVVRGVKAEGGQKATAQCMSSMATVALINIIGRAARWCVGRADELLCVGVSRGVSAELLFLP